MSLSILAKNYLTLDDTVVSASVVGPLGRLYDGDRGPLYQPEPVSGLQDIFPLPLIMTAAAVQVLIDIDLGTGYASLPVTGWGFANPANITGVSCTLKSAASSPGTNLRDTVDPALADFLRTFTDPAHRYWRVTVPALSNPMQLGELLLGPARVIAESPGIPSGLEHPLANVVTDYSPARYGWSRVRGSKLRRYVAAWEAMDITPDYDTLLLAYDDCTQGATPVQLKLPDGSVRWCRWTFLAEPEAVDDEHVKMVAIFEEAL